MDMIYNLCHTYNALASNMDMIKNGLQLKEDLINIEDDRLEITSSIEYLESRIKMLNSKNKLTASNEEELKKSTHSIVEKKKEAIQLTTSMNEKKMQLFKLYKLGFKDAILQNSESGNTIMNIVRSILNDPKFSLKVMTSESFESIVPLPHQQSMNHSLLLATDFDGKQYIAKEYKIADEKVMKQFKNELKVITRMNHANIIKVESIYSSSDNHIDVLYVIMPYYSGGDLKHYLGENQSQRTPLFWERIWRQVLMAIEYVHSCGVIHCDIKPENIFIEEVNQFTRVVLGDFDICHDNQSRTMNLKTRTIAGTIDYLAPEVLNLNEKASFSSDMYAFGMTVKNCMKMEELEACPSLQSLIEKCLSKEKDERPTASQCLASDFFLLDTLPFEEEFQQKWQQVQHSEKQLQSEKQFITKQHEELQHVIRDNELKRNELNQLQQAMNEKKLQEEESFKKKEEALQQQAMEQDDEHRKWVESEVKRLKIEKEKQLKEIYKEKMDLEEQSRKLQQQETELKTYQNKLNQKQQLMVCLPAYWKHQDVNVMAVKRVNNTRYMKSIIQELMDATCISSTLGSGRDQAVRMDYSKLIVTSVTRIEHSAIYALYSTRKKHLLSYKDQQHPIAVQTEKLIHGTVSNDWMKQSGLTIGCNEKYLWHGTKPETASIIYEHGFDERVASLSGLFGAGVYFAECCSKSDQYCTPDGNGEFCMFLCRVAMGQQIHYANGHASRMRRPPEVPNGNGRAYDSVIGQSNASSSSYREFIVYDGNQCYPEFLVKYKRE